MQRKCGRMFSPKDSTRSRSRCARPPSSTCVQSVSRIAGTVGRNRRHRRRRAQQHVGIIKPVLFIATLKCATEVFSIRYVNSKQMKKWLEQQGATFAPGKGSHLKVFLNGRQSALPMHGTAELGKGLEAAIKRQLGLK